MPAELKISHILCCLLFLFATVSCDGTFRFDGLIDQCINDQDCPADASCNNNLCKKKPKPHDCYHKTVGYYIGETFQAADKCNTCVCNQHGKVTCSNHHCDPMESDCKEDSDCEEGRLCFQNKCQLSSKFVCQLGTYIFQHGENLPGPTQCEWCTCLYGERKNCYFQTCVRTYISCKKDATCDKPQRCIDGYCM